MTIVILHRVPFEKARYDQVIDHHKNDVLYIGTAATLAKIPPTISAKRMSVSSLTSKGEILAAINGAKVDQIIALSEYDLLMAADVRELLGISGASRATALLTRDKVIMKSLVKQCHLPVPRHARLCDQIDLSDWQPPFILKPVDGASSEGVELISSREALEARLKELGPCSGFEMEEYLEGPIFHLDGWKRRGQMMDFIPSRYVGTCLDYAKGSPMGSHQVEDDWGRFRHWADQVTAAVGIEDGAFHLEGIQCRGQMYFLEVAHRIGGAGVARTFQMRTGINLYQAHIGALLKLPIPTYQKESSGMFGWFLFPGYGLPKADVSVMGTKDLDCRPEYFDLKVTERVANQKLTYDSSEIPFSGFVRGTTGSDARDLICEVFERVTVVLSE